MAWVLSTLEGIRAEQAAAGNPHWKPPPVAVLPLGTGALGVLSTGICFLHAAGIPAWKPPPEAVLPLGTACWACLVADAALGCYGCRCELVGDAWWLIIDAMMWLGGRLMAWESQVAQAGLSCECLHRCE